MSKLQTLISSEKILSQTTQTVNKQYFTTDPRKNSLEALKSVISVSDEIANYIKNEFARLLP